jgi:hypothetical protein
VFSRAFDFYGHLRAAAQRLVDYAIALSQFQEPRSLVRSCLRVQDDAKPDLFEADLSIFHDPQRTTNVEVAFGCDAAAS